MASSSEANCTMAYTEKKTLKLGLAKSKGKRFHATTNEWNRKRNLLFKWAINYFVLFNASIRVQDLPRWGKKEPAPHTQLVSDRRRPNCIDHTIDKCKAKLKYICPDSLKISSDVAERVCETDTNTDEEKEKKKYEAIPVSKQWERNQYNIMRKDNIGSNSSCGKSLLLEWYIRSGQFWRNRKTSRTMWLCQKPMHHFVWPTMAIGQSWFFFLLPELNCPADRFMNITILNENNSDRKSKFISLVNCYVTQKSSHRQLRTNSNRKRIM